MKVTETRCDRCKKPIHRHARLPDGITMHHKAVNKVAVPVDLCDECGTAFERFMRNEDQVGQYFFAETDGPCLHHIPCAGPCGETVWKLKKRSKLGV